MNARILQDPAFALGMCVWFLAATVLPFQLGLTRAGAPALALYLAIAGMLLAVADALLNPALYRRLADVALQGVFWTIGLALPAAILFAIGTAAAPASDGFDDELCRLAGLAHREAGPEAALEDAFEPTEACELC